MRVEAGADRVDTHDDLRLELRGRDRAAFGLGALRRRRRADGAAGERQQRNQQASGHADPAGSFRHAPQGIGARLFGDVHPPV
jgi:hypothetical protein